MPVKIINANGHFSRGRGLNLAAKEAAGDVLFFVDADAFFTSRDVFERGLLHVTEGKAYFPVLYSYSDSSHSSGWWRHEGFGHCMVTREIFERSGGWPEYERWGKEDDDFYTRIAATTPVVREQVPGFFHQWHPEEIQWKDRYSKHYPALKEELERVARAWEEIAQVVPCDGKFILVDEMRFGSDPMNSRRALPFLERNGEYWGCPPDDATAIAEFKRLAGQGVTHIVFGWMCFWWLDHYKGFASLLRDCFPAALANENLIAFDLRGISTS
jgi:hypothetical protein